MLQKTPPALQAHIKGIGHVVVQVEDLDAAQTFYVSTLGFPLLGRDLWPVPGGGASATLKAGAGQHVTLAKATPLNDPRVSAAHQAYAFAPAARAKLIDALTAKGIAVHRYSEDRPSEAADNVYIEDPTGNRIQLVAREKAGSGAPCIDHVGVETNNILWSREFYSNWLGFPLEHRVGWKTTDYLNAKMLGEAGMAAAMPGARYWNERYSQFEKERKALRPCAQIYLSLGGGTSLAVYLAARLYQAPRDDIVRGVPCLGLVTTADGLDKILAFFRDQGRDVEGPVSHDKGAPVATSAFVKDPGGNFLEFCVPR